MRKTIFCTLSRRLQSLFLVGTVVLVGCDFEVKNPGRILEADLNTPSSVRPLVVGMSADFSEEYDQIAFAVARLSDEMTGSGSYNSTGLFRTGVVERELMNGNWAGMQRARWVAEDGVRRMQEEVVDDEGNPWAWQGTEYVATAYFFAGLANERIGETFCYGVVARGDSLGGGGGAEQPPSESFLRAIDMFQEAITHATTAGEDILVEAARGGIAQAYLGLENRDQAESWAGQVATDFEYFAIYSDNSGREENVLRVETFNRPEMSCYGAPCGAQDPPDPRANYTQCDVTGTCATEQGADGLTPHWRQEKFPDLGSWIPVVKGTEMRLIEAEVLLRRDSDWASALAKMNEVRTYHNMPALTATNADEVWVLLDQERHFELWLEARRLFDMHRWDVAANRNRLPSIQFLYGDLYNIYEMDPNISRRTSCLPISFDECGANPNLSQEACGDLF